MSGGNFPARRLVGVVGLGGAFGSLTRYAVETLLPTSNYRWPWATFLVNMAGAFAIGVVVGLLAQRELRGQAAPQWVRPLAVTGYLGGLTTFSTYMVEVFNRLDSGEPLAYLVGITYLFVTTLGGIGLVVFGLTLVERRFPPVDTETMEEAEEA